VLYANKIYYEHQGSLATCYNYYYTSMKLPLIARSRDVVRFTSDGIHHPIQGVLNPAMPGRQHTRTSCWFQKPVLLAYIIAMGLPTSPVIHNLFRQCFGEEGHRPKQLRILASLMAYNPAFSSLLRLRGTYPS